MMVFSFVGDFDIARRVVFSDHAYWFRDVVAAADSRISEDIFCRSMEKAGYEILDARSAVFILELARGFQDISCAVVKGGEFKARVAGAIAEILAAKPAVPVA
ncbi:MAG: hypothetical protein M3O22_02310 [Pseudomonadota bacterium]|nr:hypothetical protein [Pseudomonadota bacterium]